MTSEIPRKKLPELVHVQQTHIAVFTPKLIWSQNKYNVLFVLNSGRKKFWFGSNNSKFFSFENSNFFIQKFKFFDPEGNLSFSPNKLLYFNQKMKIFLFRNIENIFI